MLLNGFDKVIDVPSSRLQGRGVSTVIQASGKSCDQPRKVLYREKRLLHVASKIVGRGRGLRHSLISYWLCTNRRQAVSFFGRIVSVIRAANPVRVASPGPSFARRVGALSEWHGSRKDQVNAAASAAA
jgi:hypothetical protein